MKIKLKVEKIIDGVSHKIGDIVDVSESEARMMVCSLQGSYAKAVAPEPVIADPVIIEEPIIEPKQFMSAPKAEKKGKNK